MDEQIDNVKAFGLIVKERRKALEYTQTHVSALCGTGVRFISDLENGKETIEFGKALTIAHALGIDVFARVRGDAP